MFDILFSKVKILFKNPMIIFVYGIVTKWYVTIFISAVVVVFWVFKGLQGAGFIQAAEDVVFRALKDTKSVARYCIPKIANLHDFWDCVQSPPEYEETEDELKLKKNITNLLQTEPGNEEDPYNSP
jgi:hypothetical protein